MRRLAALLLGVAAGLLAGELLVRAALALRSAPASGYGAPISTSDARLGWRLQPGARARHVTPEFDVEVAIDADGFRQNPAPPTARTPGVRRVVVLGDSFVFGQGVPESARLTEQLAARLGAEVVNLGVPGTGTDQQWLQFSQPEGPQHGADLVLLAYFVEHVARNGAAQRDGRSKPVFRLEQGELRLADTSPAGNSPAVVATPVEDRRAWAGLRRLLWAHSQLYVLFRRHVLPHLLSEPQRAADDPYPQYGTDDPAWAVTQALFARLRDAARAEGAQFAIAFIPEAWQLRAGAPERSRGACAQACERLAIPFLDLTPALRAAEARAPQPVYYPLDGHWTAAGHAAAAEALAAFIPELWAGR